MMIIHTRYQHILMMDEATGELTERRLDHEERPRPMRFYRNVQSPVRVGIEVSADSWFERLLAELGHELWIEMLQDSRQRSAQGRPMKHALLILIYRSQNVLLESAFPRRTGTRPAAVALMLTSGFACAPCWATSGTR